MPKVSQQKPSKKQLSQQPPLDQVLPNSNPPPIKNKKDFVRRYQKGEFGNAGPTWETIEAFLSATDTKGYYHLRNRIPGGPTHYDQTHEDIKKFYYHHSRPDLPNWYVSKMAPTEKTTIQGEVRLSTYGVEFRYSCLALPMRAALSQSQKTVTGLTAVMLLKQHLNASSYDWLIELLELYPDHIIEISAYSQEWGTIPGYNCVFWEVRPDRSFSSNQSPSTEVY